MRDEAQFRRVSLIAAQIEGNVEARKSTFEDELSLGGSKIDGVVFLDDGAQFREVNLTGAQIGGDVYASESKFQGELDLDLAQIRGSVYLHGSQFTSSVSCSGTTIEGVLALSGDKDPTWHDSASIDLEGSTVRAIDDSEGGWPKHVWLSGLVIEQAHGQTTGLGQGIMDRPTGWYRELLRRDRGFSRESYKQLEALLRSNGRTRAADDIATARMDNEYASEGGLRRVVGFFHRYTVGYGYHPEWAIYWIVALIAIGAFVAKWLPESIHDSVPSRFILSAQRLIPLIDFGKTYSDAEVTGKDVPAGVRGYFYVHAILGYVLAAFLVAALTQVTTT